MIVRADALRIPLADRSVDLVMGSPPYGPQRTYGIKASRKLDAWVEWMLAVTAESLRVSRGLVVWVCAGWTRKVRGAGRLGCYQPGPELLLGEWVRRGGFAWRPNYWARSGIPGSGQGVWYRADVEHILAFKRLEPLDFADPLANGHPPKCQPGGRMTHRNKEGLRDGLRKAADEGKRLVRITRRKSGSGRRQAQEYYVPPEIADPGNLVRTPGGHLGSKLGHRNEAPYHQTVPERFVRSHCPPGGLVFDPFSGSGTTAAAALSEGRRYVAADLRQSQCELTRRRVATVTPSLPFGAPS